VGKLQIIEKASGFSARNFIKKAGINRELLITLQECKEQLTTTWANYKLLKKQAAFLHATWLEEIAAAKADK
jgi:hypothetical protein